MGDVTFDAIVVGLGGMGSATAFELARRGRHVLGLEQFPLVHDQGSSHGQTRIIRQAYYEHPDYVPLARRAYGGWYDLEQRTGRHLLTECPCLSIGPPHSHLLAGVLASSRRHELPVETLAPAELRRRFPEFVFGQECSGVLERSAGFLFVEDCVRAHLAAAANLGATLHAGEPVVEWSATATGVEVRTTKGAYAAGRLVLTSGPWAPRLLGRCGVPLAVMRQVPMWFEPREPARFRRDVFPVFIAETPEGDFYGLPAVDGNGAKVARHYGAAELQDVGQVSRVVSPEDEGTVRAFLRAYLPGLDGPRRRASVCIYTLTPDRHFVIDVHPEHAVVAIACGFSGHGFKFAPVVGEVLADLADRGRTDLPIGLFSARRFAKPSGGSGPRTTAGEGDVGG
jgi:sarcosine oxidase